MERRPSQVVVPGCAKALRQEEWKEGQCGWRDSLESGPFFKATVLVIFLNQGCQIKCRMPS